MIYDLDIIFGDFKLKFDTLGVSQSDHSNQTDFSSAYFPFSENSLQIGQFFH